MSPLRVRIPPALSLGALIGLEDGPDQPRPLLGGEVGGPLDADIVCVLGLGEAALNGKIMTSP